jgi:hypothetical protein
MFPAMNRYRAALTHFGLSLLVVGTVFVLVYFLWFPGPLFRGAGGRDLFLVLAMVDVTIGPLITLIIFRAGKRGLKFDLAVIALVQVAALAYGTHVVFEARPVWTVFLKDRFDLIRANDVDRESRMKAKPEFQALSLSGPRVAAARIPADPDERFRTMLSGFAGLDVSAYPQHYVPYADARAQALAKAKPFRELRILNPGADHRLDRELARLGRKEAEVAFLPLRSGKNDLCVLVDAKTGDMLKIADFKPWKY